MKRVRLLDRVINAIDKHRNRNELKRIVRATFHEAGRYNLYAKKIQSR